MKNKTKLSPARAGLLGLSLAIRVTLMASLGPVGLVWIGAGLGLRLRLTNRVIIYTNLIGSTHFNALYGQRKEVCPFVLHTETCQSDKQFTSYKQNGFTINRVGGIGTPDQISLFSHLYRGKINSKNILFHETY